RVVVIDPVQQVEAFDAYLELPLRSEARVLRERQVDVPIAGSTQRVAPGVAERERRRPGERRRIDPAIGAVRCRAPLPGRVGVANDIGPILELARVAV